jgi:hypothetical protein
MGPRTRALSRPFCPMCVLLVQGRACARPPHSKHVCESCKGVMPVGSTARGGPFSAAGTLTPGALVRQRQSGCSGTDASCIDVGTQAARQPFTPRCSVRTCVGWMC